MPRFNFGRAGAFNAPEESPGFLLWRASTLWRRAIEATLKPLHLTHPQFVILATVAWMTRGGDKTSQAEIGKQAGLDPNTTSQILRSLQIKGLIQRSPGRDERSKHPLMTEAGSKLLTLTLPAVEKADAHFFSKVDMHQEYAHKALQVLAAVAEKGQKRTNKPPMKKKQPMKQLNAEARNTEEM